MRAGLLITSNQLEIVLPTKMKISFVLVCCLAAVYGMQEYKEVDPRFHLAKFGNYNPFSFNGNDDSFNEALKEYQTNHGLKVTGVFDDETKSEMSKPRCGLPDKSTSDGLAYYKTWRYKWGHTDMTYAYDNTGRDQPESVMKATIKKAFDMWSAVTPLTFREVSRGQGNINIGWYVGNHGDNSPFQRRAGGVLAHAFFPRNGRLHFDEMENWIVNCQGRGTDLLWVAVHEIGHALGLEHSNVRGTIMWPTYYRCNTNLALHNDDIAGIQSLYGKKGGTGTGGTGTGGGNNCPDNHRRCAEWANRGECRKNPNWMLRNCKKSCKQRC